MNKDRTVRINSLCRRIVAKRLGHNESIPDLGSEIIPKCQKLTRTTLSFFVTHKCEGLNMTAALRQLVTDFRRSIDLYLKDLVIPRADLFLLGKSREIDLTELEQYFEELQSKIENKPQHFEHQCHRILEFKLDEETLNKMQQAEILVLKARTMNIMTDSGLEIDEHILKGYLDKALELDSQSSCANCELGEYLWRIGQIHEAEKNSEAHWKLSMALRHLQSNEVAFKNLCSKESQQKASDMVPLLESKRVEILKKSLSIAKQSTSLDACDARAWECLGNSLVTFCARLKGTYSQLNNLQQQMLDAYSQALAAKTDASVFYDPNFHLSRSIAFSFQQHSSLQDSQRVVEACFLSTLFDPDWTTPLNHIVNLLMLLHRVRSMLQNASEEDCKRLSNCLQLAVCRHLVAPEQEKLPKIKDPLAKLVSRVFGPLQLQRRGGSDENYNMSDTPVAASLLKKHSFDSNLLPKQPLKLVSIANLAKGMNENSVLIGRVQQGIVESFDGDLALNSILVDAFGQPFHLRVIKAAKNCGPRHRDILAIPNPELVQVTIDRVLMKNVRTLAKALSSSLTAQQREKFDAVVEEEITLSSVVVYNAESLILNGKPVGADWNGPLVVENIFYT
ncbi:hypothetical protein Ciccas_005654 [Cichlidogyrus casuarinus]|uniref:Tetratricopeptide repeat protein 5 OB fold domain-containing protein n=1 Tax=Cichlidogyrus casuarinus TaxID=1844966 RepID=A0ABD2Q900_9PLAT